MKNTNTYLFLIVFMFTALNVVRAQQDSQISNPLTEHYFYQNGEKVAYPLRPYEFYVQVKPIHSESNNLVPQANINQISGLLDSLGLFISYKNYNDEALLKYEAESINGKSGFSPCVLFVKRKDSLPFDMRNSIALKQLRLSPFIRIAGPIVLQEYQERFSSYTYGNEIRFTVNSKMHTEQVNEFLKSIGLQRVKPNFNIVETPIEDAISVVDYVERFMESGLFEKVEMDVYYNAYLD